jgi:hypothetical protein
MRTVHKMPQLMNKKQGDSQSGVPLEYLEDSSGSGPSMKRPSVTPAQSVRGYKTRQTHRRGKLSS